MKTKLKIVAFAACVSLAVLTSGCASSQVNALANVVTALGKDPNNVHMSVVSSFGTIEIDRSGPVSGTNGTVTVGGSNGITTK